MQVRVINLDRSVARREAMTKRLRELGLSFSLISAVDGLRGDLKSFSQFLPAGLKSRYGNKLSVGEMGCFASHFSLWQQCAASDTPMLILEDDLILDDRFPEVVALAENLLASSASFVRLCGLRRKRAPTTLVQQLSPEYDLVCYRKGPLGTQAYALSPKGAGILVGHARVWAEPVDVYIDRFWFHGVPPLGILPFRATTDHRETLTDIDPPLSATQHYVRRALRLRDEIQRIIFLASGNRNPGRL